MSRFNIDFYGKNLLKQQQQEQTDIRPVENSITNDVPDYPARVEHADELATTEIIDNNDKVTELGE